MTFCTLGYAQRKPLCVLYVYMYKYSVSAHNMYNTIHSTGRHDSVRQKMSLSYVPLVKEVREECKV